MSVNGREIEFEYPAKIKQRRTQSIVDSDVHDVVCGLKRRRDGGRELLAYKNSRKWVDVSSADVNEYLKQVAGGDFTASGWTIGGVLPENGDAMLLGNPRQRKKLELAVLDLLEERESPAIEKV